MHNLFLRVIQSNSEGFRAPMRPIFILCLRTWTVKFADILFLSTVLTEIHEEATTYTSDIGRLKTYFQECATFGSRREVFSCGTLPELMMVKSPYEYSGPAEDIPDVNFRISFIEKAFIKSARVFLQLL